MNPLSPLPAILDQTKAHNMQPTLCAGYILRTVQTALMHIPAPTATWAFSLGRPALCHPVMMCLAQANVVQQGARPYADVVP